MTCSDSTVRRITMGTGRVVTIAGTPGESGRTDDGESLYAADENNHVVRKID